MAEIVTIEGEQFKKRNVFAVWLGLPLITLWVYHFVWWYKINDEARRYLRDESIRPGISVLAITLGVFLIVPPFVSVYRTAERIQRMQDNAGVQQGRIEPVLALVAALFFSLHVVYIQYTLNKLWDLYLGVQPAAPGGRPLEPPPPPPPPLPAE